MKTFRRILLFLPLLPLLLLIGFALWAWNAAGPAPAALVALQSDAQVTVTERTTLTERPSLTFAPAAQPARVGLILYPGARVDPRAYAPLAHAIAAQGFLVVVPAMPLNMAMLAPNRATQIMADHPEVTRWVVGGHSLGGAMAASYTRRHPQQVQGLVLWAAYPAQSDDLSALPLPVVLISGDRDGLATPADVEASRPLLPPDARLVAIPGGNHAQFAQYGPQSGDLPAEISPEQQQAVVVATTAALLQSLIP